MLHTDKQINAGKNIYLLAEVNNAKMFAFQILILWYGDKCGVHVGMLSTECPF